VAVVKPATELKSENDYQTPEQFYIWCNDCNFPFIWITWSAPVIRTVHKERPWIDMKLSCVPPSFSCEKWSVPVCYHKNIVTPLKGNLTDAYFENTVQSISGSVTGSYLAVFLKLYRVRARYLAHYRIMCLLCLYSEIQSCTTVLKELVGETLGAEKCKYFFFQIRFRFRVTAFLHLFRLFLQNGNSSFWHDVSIDECNERKKENSARCCIFSVVASRVLFEHVSDRVVRTCHTCYRHYCPSLITALQLSVLSRILSAEISSNDHKNTKCYQR
jgi:hypothetical protein